MSRILKPNFETSDDRGILREIVRDDHWRQLNEYERKKGSVAGNHYHKNMFEFFYVISGSIRVVIYNINSKKREEFTAGKGAAFRVEPYEVHTLSFLEDSTFITLLSHTFDSSNPDMYKYESLS